VVPRRAAAELCIDWTLFALIIRCHTHRVCSSHHDSVSYTYFENLLALHRMPPSKHERIHRKNIPTNQGRSGSRRASVFDRGQSTMSLKELRGRPAVFGNITLETLSEGQPYYAPSRTTLWSTHWLVSCATHNPTFRYPGPHFAGVSSYLRKRRIVYSQESSVSRRVVSQYTNVDKGKNVVAQYCSTWLWIG
jgi:hypothetical protein